MSGVKLEVQWSPAHPDKFITWGTEIFLYEIVPLKDASKSSSVKVSDTLGANLLATNSNHHYVKCVDIYPQSEPDILLAIGQANGKITLTTFGPTAFDSRGLTGKELAPRHARQCNTLAWNPVESNLIAAGLDKNRADHCVLLWDVFKCPHYIDSKGIVSVNSSHHHHVGSSGPEVARPVAELGMSEIAHSLAWFYQPRCLIVGMNNKHLRLVDLRDSSKIINSTPTKAVYGLTVDPFNDYQVASFVENQISIWDTRNFEKPVLTVTQAKPVTKVLWCPTRRNLLGSLLRDTSTIYLHDIRHTVVGNDEVEPSVLERSVQPCPASNITSFSWHPTHENRLLTIALSGMINDYVVFERITLNWSPNSAILWTQGRRFLKYVSDKDSFYHTLDDISVMIKKRALSNYGLKPELGENGDLAEDEHLKKVWQWLSLSRLSLSRSHLDDERMRGTSSRLPGVRCILKMDGSQQSNVMKSEQLSVPWSDLPGNGFFAKIYRSEDRFKALQLCGWNFGADSTGLSSFLERLEAEGAYARAAAIAVFNLNLRTAIEILNLGSACENEHITTANLNIVALALAGFSDEKGSMWRELCVTSQSQLTDPYLRAMFAFLTDDGDSYENVLNESGIAVEDRVAFACIYLSDNKLNDYLRHLMIKLIEEGNLAGMLLTGNSSDTVELLQSYLEATGDIQSVCLLAVRTFSSELLQGPTVQLWITSYRTLLDSWHLWNQRAQFDILLSVCSASDKPPQQVFVSCNFCGKSISAQMQGHNKNRGSYARLGTTSQKLKESTFHEAIFDGNRGNYVPSYSNVPHGMSACPQCRKPLPRCAICLMNMGTASGLQNSSGSSSNNSNGRHTSDKLADFSSWFTWCQTCRHGGHAAHMTHWFKEHSECPVTACTCRCLSLDAASKVSSIHTH